jgi:RNA polymerase sigma-70 factor (ECF subfamily)
MSIVNDRQESLVRRLRAGDRTAAAGLADAYYQQIYMFMRRLGHSKPVSEDLTQECFLAAWQHLGQLRDDIALNGWLYRIAGNVSKMYWRRHKVSQISIEQISLADASGGAGAKAEQAEQLGRVQNALLEMPMKLRQVIVLHYMQNLTITEAAEAAGIRQGAFKSRLNAAIKKLKKRLAEPADGEL